MNSQFHASLIYNYILVEKYSTSIGLQPKPKELLNKQAYYALLFMLWTK